MTLDKAIKHGREHRKPHQGSKSIDRTCCNHGSCPACKDNRLHGTRKRKLAAKAKEIDE